MRDPWDAVPGVAESLQVLADRAGIDEAGVGAVRDSDPALLLVDGVGAGAARASAAVLGVAVGGAVLVVDRAVLAVPNRSVVLALFAHRSCSCR